MGEIEKLNELEDKLYEKKNLPELGNRAISIQSKWKNWPKTSTGNLKKSRVE
ncbi:MAG: hypothetical protein U0W24_10510 [Bacteroidales bacterium]